MLVHGIMQLFKLTSMHIFGGKHVLLLDPDPAQPNRGEYYKAHGPTLYSLSLLSLSTTLSLLPVSSLFLE